MTTSTLPLQHWKPRSYQEDAVKLMIGQGALGLLLDPGLGKTSVSFAAFAILKSTGHVSKMLVIAPLRPAYLVWPKERNKWYEFHTLKVHVLHGKGKDNIPDDADIYVINPEGLEWLVKKGLVRLLGLDMLVVDESTKFKHTNTQRFKLLKVLLPAFKRRYILTGTPTPNGLMDLFGQIYLLDQGHALGRFITHYRREYFYESGYGGYEYRPKIDSLERITKRVAPLTLRLKAEDHLEMPDLIYSDIPIKLPPAARKLYNDMENTFVAALDSGEVAASNAAVASGKLRQIVNGALYSTDALGDRDFKVLHTEKLDALEDMLEQLGGQPLLLLYEFDFEREMIQKKFNCPALGGGVSMKKAAEIEAAFNRGEIPLLIGQPAAMGHGLNLQEACHHVLWYGLTWNLELYDQATRRVYRQGQQAGTVFVYRLVAEETIDEVVRDSLAGKDRTQTVLMKELSTYRKRMGK